MRTVVANYILWPAAHLVNFRFVPSEQRILFNNCVSVSVELPQRFWEVSVRPALTAEGVGRQLCGCLPADCMDCIPEHGDAHLRCGRLLDCAYHSARGDRVRQVLAAMAADLLWPLDPLSIGTLQLQVCVCHPATCSLTSPELTLASNPYCCSPSHVLQAPFSGWAHSSCLEPAACWLARIAEATR